MSAWASSIVHDHLKLLADFEKNFGPATALLRYGREFKPVDSAPDWLVLGAGKACYDNAARLALSRDDVHYAEGFAIDLAGLPIPIEHAWLVDLDGRVIDPTWQDSHNHCYLGISFAREFVCRMFIEANGTGGLLVNPPLMRRHFGTPELFEAARA